MKLYGWNSRDHIVRLKADVLGWLTVQGHRSRNSSARAIWTVVLSSSSLDPTGTCQGIEQAFSARARSGTVC
jgi:hypothetical protein